MTCIIGLELENTALVGADSCTACGNDRELIKDKKIFRKEKFIFAHTGTARARQIIQYLVDIPIPKEFDIRFVIKQIAEPIRIKMKEIGYSEIENNKEKMRDLFLVAYGNKVFKVYANFTASRAESGLVTSGCGGRYAMGAMLALSNIEPKDRINQSLEISSQCSVAVEPPFIILETEK